MRSTAHLTREQLRALLFRPATKEEAEERRKAHEDAAWLLRLNLCELEREESNDSDDSDPTAN